MTRAPLRQLACALVSLGLTAWGPPRAAEDANLEAARAAFKQGSALAEQKQWRAAVARYSRSLSLHRSALTLYSLGVAQRAAGQLVAARATFEAFLAEPVTPATQGFTELARAAITELGTHIASVTIVLTPAPVPDATATIDGVPVAPGTLSQRHAIDPGAHSIVARAPGRAVGRAHIRAAEGDSVTVTLTLTPLPGSRAASPALVSPAAPGPLRPERPATPAVPWPRALPIVLMGTGGVAIAGGLTLGLLGRAEAYRLNSRSGPTVDEARAKGIAGDLLAGSGVAVAGAGLILLLVQVSRPAASARVRPSVSAGGAGLSVSF